MKHYRIFIRELVYKIYYVVYVYVSTKCDQKLDHNEILSFQSGSTPLTKTKYIKRVKEKLFILSIYLHLYNGILLRNLKKDEMLPFSAI